MALHAPPVANETDAIIGFLGQAQDAFPALLHGLTAAQAARSPSASSLSLGALVKHVTDVQLSWLAKAEAAPGPVQETPEDEAAYLESFRFEESDSLDDVLAAHAEASAAVLDAVRRIDLGTVVPVPDAPWFPTDGPPWSVRWIWWHLMEELSRHAGHGDIIRETLDGATMYALVAAREGLADLPFIEAWQPATEVDA
ncbi:DinB family protein [Nocardioides cynanchi]|uniref:DinB family protein n=1 Tax=Nocardioides cynanchi TaxID=2558918 RepID=UPI0012440E2F|nr:DinB family protein [Nocardioides cynanchi]